MMHKEYSERSNGDSEGKFQSCYYGYYRKINTARVHFLSMTSQRIDDALTPHTFLLVYRLLVAIRSKFMCQLKISKMFSTLFPDHSQILRDFFRACRLTFILTVMHTLRFIFFFGYTSQSIIIQFVKTSTVQTDTPWRRKTVLVRSAVFPVLVLGRSTLLRTFIPDTIGFKFCSHLAHPDETVVFSFCWEGHRTREQQAGVRVVYQGVVFYPRPNMPLLFGNWKLLI